MSAEFAWWSARQADRQGFSIYQGLNGHYLGVTFTTSEPDGADLYKDQYPDLYYVGAVDKLIECIAVPVQGFGDDDFEGLEDAWGMRLPPIKRKPPQVVNYSKRRNKIIIDLEL